MRNKAGFNALSTRTFNILARHGVDTVEDIKALYPQKLLRLHGFGMTGLREIEAIFFPTLRYEPHRYEKIGRPHKFTYERFPPPPHLFPPDT
ncbi:DNA-directed RNA polymerase subunit alpha C-terminal domain-containing protein [Comamonas odontotermitis]|uniref:DNA-directed RNA polymerase subunit alpha C-terminal domain-containing protein n=1 Tax=Comamonas odontotermitis TaxID=379895 RepID=UPI00366F3E65